MASGSGKKFLARQKILSGESVFENADAATASSPWVKKAQLPAFARPEKRDAGPFQSETKTVWATSAATAVTQEPTSAPSDWLDMFDISPWSGTSRSMGTATGLVKKLDLPKHVRVRSRNVNEPRPQDGDAAKTTGDSDKNGWKKTATGHPDTFDTSIGEK